MKYATDWGTILLGSIIMILGVIYFYMQLKDLRRELEKGSSTHPQIEDAEDQYWGYLKCKSCGGHGPPSTRWGSYYMFDHAYRVLCEARKTSSGEKWIVDPKASMKRKRKYTPPCGVCSRRKRLNTKQTAAPHMQRKSQRGPF